MVGHKTKIIVLQDIKDVPGNHREFKFRVFHGDFEALVTTTPASSQWKKEQVGALCGDLLQLVQALSAAAGNSELIDWSQVGRT
jgi:hypothetical protein